MEFTDSCAWDQYVYKYPSVLQVFAAGNQGRHFGIETPGTCKNVITVGYIDRLNSFGAYGHKHSWIEAPNGTIFKVNQTVNYYGDIIGRNIINATVKTALDEDGKEISVYVHEGNETDLTEVRRNATEKHFIGVIHAGGECYVNSNLAPCILVSKEDLREIKKLDNLAVMYKLRNSGHPGIGKYSSMGPTRVGLIKPEVVAPGTKIMSAKGLYKHDNELFDVVGFEGTSFATPAISGITALARQYFLDGYFPTLVPNDVDKMNVSSALLKAVIINSAIPWNKEGSYEPDDTFGFGLPALDRALGFVEGIGATFLETEIKNGEHVTYKLETDRVANLTITMSYIDTYSGSAALVYNLDLIVIGPNNTKAAGNHRENFTSDMSSTTERIHIKDSPVGEYYVHVIFHPLGRSVVADRVTTEIAAMGGFSTTKNLLERQNKAECLAERCNEAGFPICNETKRGNFCQEEIIETTELRNITLELTPRIPKWVHLRPGKNSDIVFTSSLRSQQILIDVSRKKPLGQFLYSDLNMRVSFEYSTMIKYGRESVREFVDENGELYVGLTTIGTGRTTVTVSLDDIPQTPDAPGKTESTDASTHPEPPSPASSPGLSAPAPNPRPDPGEGTSKNEEDFNNSKGEKGKAKRTAVVASVVSCVVVAAAIAVAVIVVFRNKSKQIETEYLEAEV